MDYVAYIRITNRKDCYIQQEIKEQKELILEKLKNTDWVQKQEYIDIKAKNSKHSKLIEALEFTKDNNCMLIIPKIGKLHRSSCVLEKLREYGVDFIILDNLIVQQQNLETHINDVKSKRKQISSNIRIGIKQSPKKIGNHDNNAKSLRKYIQLNGNYKAVEEIKRQADDYALKLKPIIEEIQSDGHNSLGKIADELERRGVKTPRGKTKWYKTSVRILLARIENVKRKNEALNDLSDLI